jgi:ABC-2 type transport system permease protein
MLLYKAWIETRVRFLAGLAGVAIITAWDLQHPRFNSTWSFLGIHDYGYYLWHSLYDESLQQIWAVCAVVLAFGGLIHEKTSGTVSFSLGLPVSRRRWLFTRLAAVFIESVALGLSSALVVIIGSAVIHQTFSLSQMFLHTALMVAAGVFLIALGNLCYALFPGNYLSLLYTVILLGVPYAWIQLQMQRLRYYEAFCAAHSCSKPTGLLSWLTYLKYLDIPHAMAGPWQLNWATIPWISLLVIWTLTAVVLGVTVAYGARSDY